MQNKAQIYRARLLRNEAAQALPSEQDKAALEAIREEGLSPRKLRLAYRLARHLGVSARSELDAVRQLRANGVDPFDESLLFSQPATQSQPLPHGGGAPANSSPTMRSTPQGGAQQLPLKIQPKQMPVGHPQAPQAGPISPNMDDLRDLQEIQNEIQRRKKMKLAQLFFRLSIFVFLPTILAGYYYFFVATPMYKVNASLQIIAADSAGAGAGGSGGGIGSLLGGGGSSPQDSIGVQDYLESREAMQRLNEDHAFKQVFSDPSIDPIQRLSPDATDEEAFSLYSRRVTLGYDLTEGLIRLEVMAPDPEIAHDFALSLIGYAEERVDSLSERLRDDQLTTARQNLDDALEQRQIAQARLIELESDPEAQGAGPINEALREQLGQYRVELEEQRRQLAILLNNSRPNQARVDGVRRQISSLENSIANINEAINDESSGVSLTTRAVELQAAQTDLETREALLQSAIQALETATIEAGKQTRYVERTVEPVITDAAATPNPLEDTLLALIVMFGIFLLVSVSASILEEQVNS